MSADGQEPVRVRPAVAGDDAALLEVEKTAWSSDSGFPSLRDPDATTFFDDARRSVGIHVVAEYRGEVAGYIRFDGGGQAESAHVLGIHGLVVAPWARRVGVAAALLDYTEAEARRRGAHKIALGVLGSNPEAQRLYERHGFVVEGRLRDEFLIRGQFVDDVVMAKFLAA